MIINTNRIVSLRTKESKKTHARDFHKSKNAPPVVSFVLINSHYIEGPDLSLLHIVLDQLKYFLEKKNGKNKIYNFKEKIRKSKLLY